MWVIESSGDKALIGYIASRRSAATVDIGFVIDPPRWGRGFATEAASALVDELARVHGLQRIVAICDTNNKASARVLQKSGLTFRGVAKQYIQCPDHTGRRYDASLFDLSLHE